MRTIAGSLVTAVASLIALAAPAAAPRERSIYVTVEEHGRPVTDVRAWRTEPGGQRKRLTVRAKRGWRVEGT